MGLIRYYREQSTSNCRKILHTPLAMGRFYFGRLGGRQHNSARAGMQASSLARPCEIVLARLPSLQKKKIAPIASGGVVLNWTVLQTYKLYTQHTNQL